MTERCRFAALAPVVLALLVGCGGHGERPADVVPSTALPAPTAVAGPDSFLLFPNPQIQPDGSLQTNSLAYAEAYYAAIDPANAKDTLAKWKAANRFDQSGDAQVSAVFGDFRDLGYGRRMTARQNADYTIAFMVENYLVNPGGGGYGAGVNLDAAVAQDQQWRVSVNAIEFSPGPGGTVKYAKFYSFDPATGARKLMQDLDGRGEKALPSVCISCHGGRADPLTPRDPPVTGKQLFPLLQNSEPAQRGDTRARLHRFELDALTFPTMPGFTRADQEPALKTMNKMVLCTYPYVNTVAPTLAEDFCRQQDTSRNEWQAGAADLIKLAYGGSGLPAPTFGPAPVPDGWIGQEALYQSVVVPACRGCHILRGTGIGPQSDIDFATFPKFDGYDARIKYHVFERGNMPLAKIVFDRFWSTDMAERLATYLQAKGAALAPTRDANGAVLRPGHPFADAGLDRRARLGTTTLSASTSLFADSFRWRIVSGPDGAVPPLGASLSNADTSSPIFTPTLGKTYVVELVASKGSVQSAPASLKLFVNSTAAPDPVAITFGQIKTVLGSCVGCHKAGGQPPPPTTFDAADNASLRDALRGLVNFSDVAGSPLLRKPSGNHHAGLTVGGFDTSMPLGEPSRDGHDQVLNWILGGAKL